MITFNRTIEPFITERLFQGRAILIFGPRQAGKTTLAKKIVASFGKDGVYYNCELVSVRKRFVLGEPRQLKTLVGLRKVVVFDEAQTIQDIGVILKIFLDTYPEVQVIATGSSSFDLANRINEPLTGRAFEFILYPLSLAEIRASMSKITLVDLHEYLRLGTYPSVVAARERGLKEDILKNLATNYLYKDIFTFESIRNPRVFEQLVQLLAFQIGAFVSVNELSRELGISRRTVEKYLRLLEQSYVITMVRSFSRNPRNEVKKAFKVYFMDVGVRNAVIDNLASVPDRDDKGALFENFFVIERLKAVATAGARNPVMFWRDRQGHEIDVIEATGGRLSAYECKWSPDAAVSFAAFLKSYPTATTSIVTPERLLTGVDELAGSVKVPPVLKGKSIDEMIQEAKKKHFQKQ